MEEAIEVTFTVKATIHIDKDEWTKNWDAKKLRKWLEDEYRKGNVKTLGGELKAPSNIGLPSSWLNRSEREWQDLFDWIIYSCVPEEEIRR